MTGPFTETIPGAGSNLPLGLKTIHIEYEWSLDSSYNHQAGSTKETYTFAQPYGLVRWQTQLWNTVTNAYDPPTNATNYNILTPGVTGLPPVDPCGFGVNGNSGPQFADEETPAGVVDGLNKVFTLAHSPNPAASLELFDNGVLQYPTASFTLAGNTITFVVAPMAGHILLAWYRF
jgi:hypothetical protein